MRTPFKKNLESGDRVRLLKGGRSCAMGGKVGKVISIEGGTICMTLDCGHYHEAYRANVVIELRRRCVWCRGNFSLSQVRDVPFWKKGGGLCIGCWAILEINKHIQKESIKQQKIKPIRKRRKKA